MRPAKTNGDTKNRPIRIPGMAEQPPHFQPQLWQVAWDNSTNKIVGHVLTFIDENENEQFNRKHG